MRKPKNPEVRPRPALEPVFVCALAYWLITACMFPAARYIDPKVLILIAAFGLVAGVLLVYLFVSRKRNLALALVMSSAFAVFSSCSYGLHLYSANESCNNMVGFTSIEIVAISDARSSQYGSYFDGYVTQNAALGHVRVFLPSSGETVRYGDTILLKGSLSQSDFSNNEYYWQNSIVATFNVSSYERVDSTSIIGFIAQVRNKVLDTLCEGHSEDAISVIEAITCGYREDINGTTLYENYKRCGLAHMIAVSGAHFAIIIGFVAMLLNACRAPRKVTIPLIIGFSICYLVISAAPISALRAVIMSSVNLTSFFARRRASSLNSIGICIFAMIASDPSASVSISLLLSALATAGIVLFSPWFNDLASKYAPALPNAIVEPISLTLAATLLTGLVSASLFSQLPLISIISNLAVSPLFPLLCTLGLLYGLSVFLAPAAAPLFLSAAKIAAEITNAIVTAIASIPFACVPFSIDFKIAVAITACAALGLWVWWPRKISCKALLGLAGPLALCVALWLNAYSLANEIIMLDVDQGDAIIVRSNGKTMLIDTGNHDSMLLAALSRHGIFKLDYLVVSHADDDHCGSIDALRQAVEVDTVVLFGEVTKSNDSSCKKLVEQCSSVGNTLLLVSLGETLSLGHCKLSVVSPRKLVDNDGNVDSLCLYMEYDGNDDGAIDSTALFTGDAEVEQIENAAKTFHFSHIDILKESHHGSRTGLSEQLAQRLSPTIALISCGVDNDYGHPHAEVLSYLESVGSRVYRTDNNGDVSCKLDVNTVSVSTQR